RGFAGHRHARLRGNGRTRQVPDARGGDRMSVIEHADDLPAWAALAVSFFLVVGAGLTLIGTIGFARLPSFYERIHAPTLGTSWGTGGIVMASMIFFTVLATRPVVHE